MPETQNTPSPAPSLDEVDQITPGEGSSNTMNNNGGFQGPAGTNNNNATSSNDQNARIDPRTQALRAQVTQLELEVEEIRQNERLIDQLSAHIARLEAEKRLARERLRTLSSPGSIREPTPASSLGNPRGDAGLAPVLEQPAIGTFVPEGIETDPEDPDLVSIKPPYSVLRVHLDREKLLKVRMPNVYRGKNLKEWRAFTSQWEAVFRTQPWTYNRHSARVYTAASTLREEPHKAWDAAIKQRPPACKVHWPSFKNYLANLIQTTQTRQQDAFDDLRRLRQRDKETVSELHTRMIGIEAEVAP
jgi:hypothetical protein